MALKSEIEREREKRKSDQYPSKKILSEIIEK